MKFLKSVYYEKFEDLEKTIDKTIDIFFNINKISRISYEKEKNLICIKLDNGESECFVLDENLKKQLEKIGVNL